MCTRRVCKACGRLIEKSGDRVYCSRSCATRRVPPADRRLETEILRLLGERAPGASICPSEVARSVNADDWRPLMEPVRRAGRRLAERGEVVFTQKGTIVDPATVRGPIRIRRGP